MEAPLTATVHLVRHARHGLQESHLAGRMRGCPIDAEGERQAARLARHLSRAPLAAIYCSPRERAQQTAAALAAGTGHEPRTIEEVDEIDFGDWTGIRFAALSDDSLWHHWNAARGAACPPGGESMQLAQQRAVGAVERLARDHREQEVAVVSHCDIIRGVIAHYLRLPLDHMLRFDVAPASVSTVAIGDWGGQVVRVNEVPQ